MVGGVATLAVTMMQYGEYRAQLLDRIDAEIEAEVFAEALEGKPLKETKGFVVPGARDLLATAASLDEAKSRLDPVLQAMVEGKSGAGNASTPGFGSASTGDRVGGVGSNTAGSDWASTEGPTARDAQDDTTGDGSRPPV